MTPLAARPMQVDPGVLVAIGLGSNLGDRIGNIAKALSLLADEVRLVVVSPLYETEPMIVLDQPKFVNAACLIETELAPRALVSLLKSIEHRVGRQARIPNGPREIDLDLLTYGALRYRFHPGASEERALEIPHPRIAERRFVVQPLHDLDPELRVPGLDPLKVLLERTDSDATAVTLVKDAVLSIHG